MKRLQLERALIWYARRFPVRKGKLRVVNALWRATVSDRSMLRPAILEHGGLLMKCDLNEVLQRQCFYFGTYFLEEQILRCWQSVARDARIVFDVGANVGIYSLAALASQPDVIVHAFEPTPEIAAHLRETAKTNCLDRLRVHEAAVSSINGCATLRRFRGEFGTNGGMNFISQLDSGAPYPLESERVQTICLDRFCAENSIEQIDLLKLDIQGHEDSALMGARRLIRTGRIGTIFMELNWAQRPGGDCPATRSIRLLDQNGYRFSKPGNRLRWQRAGEWVRTMSDVVASRRMPS